MPSKIVKTGAGDHGTTAVTHQQKTRVWMQVIVSLILLVAGILILASPNIIFRQSVDESTKKLAAGWVGAVIGYWLS